jgi:beta-1,4-mannosyl-glycoprotein beta-1,4-N-acetylglucosaminyltransferase
MFIKIIDCFIFYNEINLLTYRLNILNDIVDKFVIVESTHTFSGKEKKLYFNENKHLFEKFNEKIIHIIVEDFPFKYPNINYKNNEQWVNEKFQRDKISSGIDTLKLDSNDILIITDLDEIPDPKTLRNIKDKHITISINTLEMDFYYYNLNTKQNIKWTLGKIVSYGKYKEIATSCSNIRGLNCVKISNSGWHLSYFGDSKFIQNKIQHFSHQEYNYEHFTDLSKIEERVKKSSDIFENHSNITKINIKDNNYLPTDYDKYLTQFYI